MSISSQLPIEAEAWSLHGAALDDHYLNPYPGPASFGPEDGAIFFGREGEVESIVTMVLAQRVSYLYAASGAGKSSLLATRIQPRLESRGWLPVDIRIGNDPVNAVRQALLQQAVLHPQLERGCALELIELVGADVTLDALADRVADATHLMPQRRRVLRTRESALAGGVSKVMPMLARVGRGGMPAEDFLRMLSLVAAQGPGGLAANRSITLGRLHELLGDHAIVSGHAALTADLLICAPGFVPVVQRLDELARRAPEVRSLPLVLVFDQFEELFTQFVDSDPSERGGLHTPAAATLPQEARVDWTLRKALIRELESLFGSCEQAERSAGPHRLLVTLREDFVAELDQLQPLAPLSLQNSFRLGWLTAEGALDAITQPLIAYRTVIEATCAQAVRHDLLREQRFVEPAPLQVVCRQLWAATVEKQEPGTPIIRFDLYDRTLRRAPTILGQYFSRLINQLKGQPSVQREALSLLEPLIISGRYRNIVQQSTLLEAPFRDREARVRAFEFLKLHRILRTERRLKGDFVEITHEYLIGSVTDRLAQRNSVEELKLMRALRLLDTRYRGAEVDTSDLGLNEFRMLHDVRGLIVWDAATRRLMLRAAVAHAAGEDAARREALAFWTHASFNDSLPSLAEVTRRLTSAAAGDVLSDLEWSWTLARLDQLPKEALRSTALLRTAVALARGDERRELVRQLARAHRGAST